MVAIYALADPRDGEVRYIGQSVSPRSRLSSHGGYTGTAPRVCQWVRSLRAEGLRPSLQILRQVPAAEAAEAEKDAIHVAVLEGYQLLNTRHVPTIRTVFGLKVGE